MRTKPLLEICVEMLEAALAAERGGADRIELCENLRVGGVTPSLPLLRAVRREVKLPIHAMIRPRAADFCYSTSEFARMKQDIQLAKREGMNGIVLGILTRDGAIDRERTKELVGFASPLPITFHRAFDKVADNCAALEDVIATGATRILTSGGAVSAEKGRGVLAKLVQRGGERITILAGGGIQPGNLARIANETNATEFHSGLSTLLPYPRTDYAAFEEGVRALAEILQHESNHS